MIKAKKAFKVTGAQGKVTFKVAEYDKKAKKRIKVSKTGKVTVKKGLKKGTHRYDVYVFALRESRLLKSVHFDAGENDLDEILQELTVTEDGRNDNCIGYGMLEGTFKHS